MWKVLRSLTFSRWVLHFYGLISMIWDLFYRIIMKGRLRADAGSICNSAARYVLYIEAPVPTHRTYPRTHQPSSLQQSIQRLLVAWMPEGLKRSTLDARRSTLNAKRSTLNAQRLRVDGLLAVVCIQEARLLTRARERPLLNSDTGISRLLRFFSLSNGKRDKTIWVRISIRLLAVIEHLGPCSSAPSQACKPPDSNEWSSAIQVKVTLVIWKLTVLIYSLTGYGQGRENLHPRRSCDRR